jgi:hemerythrin-like domain-containing protein
MSEDFSADLEHEHRLIDAGIDAYLGIDHSPATDRRVDLAHALQILRRHIYFEEEFMFPPLRALGLVGPVAVMVREHGVLWGVIAQLEAHIDDPADSNTALCQDLRSRLANHNGKEESIVYAQARELLPEADQAELSVLLRTAKMPVGWTTHAASLR